MEIGDQRHRSPNSDGKGTVRGEEAVSGEGEKMTESLGEQSATRPGRRRGGGH